VARGTTGAPRNTPGRGPGVPADGGDTGTVERRDTRNSRAPGSGDPGAGQAKRSGVSRLIAFVCGRRSKYLVVAFWILVVAAVGSLAGKLQGAEKNDASSDGTSGGRAHWRTRKAAQ